MNGENWAISYVTYFPYLNFILAIKNCLSCVKAFLINSYDIAYAALFHCKIWYFIVNKIGQLSEVEISLHYVSMGPTE